MRRRRRPDPVCAARGCGCAIERWQRFCAACWRLLPWDTRQAIGDALRDRDYLRASTLTVEAASWLAANSPAAVAARLCGEREAIDG